MTAGVEIAYAQHYTLVVIALRVPTIATRLLFGAVRSQKECRKMLAIVLVVVGAQRAQSLLVFIAILRKQLPPMVPVLQEAGSAAIQTAHGMSIKIRVGAPLVARCGHYSTPVIVEEPIICCASARVHFQNLILALCHQDVFITLTPNFPVFT